jgi:large subunit ribosomal protein L5
MQEVSRDDRVDDPEAETVTEAESTPEAEAPPAKGTATPKPRGQRVRKAAAVDGGKSAPVAARALPRLLSRYREEVAPTLRREFGHANVMAVAQVKKVVINVGLGEALTNPRALESATRDIGLITGQRPVATKARRSVARFKLREGQTIGVMATLRGHRMYMFLDKLFSTALPRIRDFRGVSRSSVDGRGNFSLGIREQIVFPEIDYNQVDRIRGFQINIITSAETDREALRLLELMGMPLAREQDAA